MLFPEIPGSCVGDAVVVFIGYRFSAIRFLYSEIQAVGGFVIRLL